MIVIYRSEAILIRQITSSGGIKLLESFSNVQILKSQTSSKCNFFPKCLTYICFIPRRRRKVKAKRDIYGGIRLITHVLRDLVNGFVSPLDIIRKDSFKDFSPFSSVPLTFQRLYNFLANDDFYAISSKSCTRLFMISI